MRSFLLAIVVCGCAGATPPAQSAGPVNSTPTPTEAAAPSAAASSSAATSPAATPETDAEHAAEAWLAEVDAGQYAQSWTEAATQFKSAVDQPSWLKAVDAVRAPLGSLKSRALRSAHYATSLPGAPDGQYVVLQFESAFDKKSSAIETVTPTKDSDGRWRVSGYFIK